MPELAANQPSPEAQAEGIVADACEALLDRSLFQARIVILAPTGGMPSCEPSPCIVEPGMKESEHLEYIYDICSLEGWPCSGMNGSRVASSCESCIRSKPSCNRAAWRRRRLT